MLTRSRHAFWIALLVLSGAAPAPADILCLKDGRVFDEVTLSRSEGGVTVQFENGDIEVPSRLIQDFVIENDTGFVAETDEDRENIAKGKVRFDGKWMTVRERDKRVETLIEEQREALEEIRETRVWRNRLKESSKNFDFEVTVPRHVFESYRDLCEEYFSEFVKTFKIKKPKDLGNLQVKFYVDREAFMQVSGAPRGVLGFFRFVEPYELNIYYDRLDPKGTEEVMYHEVGHYLAKLVVIDFKYPHWPGESLCEYYAASTWDPVKKKLDWGGLHPGRITSIKQDIEKDEWVDLRDMILGCNDRNYHDHDWGWSFVHYLMSQPKHAKNFKKFYLALARGRDVDRTVQTYGRIRMETVSGGEMLASFMKYMKLKDDDDLRELEEDWYTHVRENLQLSDARGFENAAVRSLRLGRKHRAKRQLEQAIELGSTKSVTYHRLARVLADMDEDEAAREKWRRAIALDPLVPEYYIALGSSLLGEKDPVKWEEGKRLLYLALDIEPDNFYLERNLESLLQRSRRRQQDEAAEGADDDGAEGSGE